MRRFVESYLDTCSYFATVDAAHHILRSINHPPRRRIRTYLDRADNSVMINKIFIPYDEVRLKRKISVEEDLRSLIGNHNPWLQGEFTSFIEKRHAVYAEHAPAYFLRSFLESADPLYRINTQQRRVEQYVHKRFYEPYYDESRYIAVIDMALKLRAPFWQDPFTYRERRAAALGELQNLVKKSDAIRDKTARVAVDAVMSYSQLSLTHEQESSYVTSVGPAESRYNRGPISRLIKRIMYRRLF